MRNFILLIAVCVLIGCVNNSEIQKFPARDYPRFTQETFSREETVALEYITIRYVPDYDPKRQVVHISGSVSLNRDRIKPGSSVTDFALNLFGLDTEYTVVNKGSFHRLSFPRDADSIPFKLDLPYSTAVKFIGFKCNFKHGYVIA